MKKLTALLTALLLVLAVAVGLFLPEAVSAMADKKAVSSETRAMEAVNIGYHTDLTFLDKIASLQQVAAASAIAVSDGQWHNRQEVQDIALSFCVSLMPAAGNAEVRSAIPYIYTLTDGSSFLVWELEMEIPLIATCHFDLDDVTGAILRFQISSCDGTNLLRFLDLPNTDAYIGESGDTPEMEAFTAQVCQALADNYAGAGVEIAPLYSESGFPIYPELPLMLCKDGAVEEAILFLSEEAISYS